MTNSIAAAFTTVALIVSVVMGYYTLTQLKSTKREYFVLWVICVVIYQFGYLFEMTASTICQNLRMAYSLCTSCFL